MDRKYMKGYKREKVGGRWENSGYTEKSQVYLVGVTKQPSPNISKARDGYHTEKWSLFQSQYPQYPTELLKLFSSSMLCFYSL